MLAIRFNFKIESWVQRNSPKTQDLLNCEKDRNKTKLDKINSNYLKISQTELMHGETVCNERYK